MAEGTPSFYDVLGVPPRARPEEIRRADVAQARRLHPDTGSGHADARAMQALNEAWFVLRDPRRRYAYDRELGGEVAGPAPPETGERDDYVAAALVEDAPRPPAAGDLVMLVPAALLICGIVSLALGAMTVNARLLALAFALMLVSGAAFLVAPLLSMARHRRRP